MVHDSSILAFRISLGSLPRTFVCFVQLCRLRVKHTPLCMPQDGGVTGNIIATNLFTPGLSAPTVDGADKPRLQQLPKDSSLNIALLTSVGLVTSFVGFS